MKTSFISRLSLSIVALSSILFFSGAYDMPDPLTVRIEKDALLINNTTVSKDWRVNTFQQVIGKPDDMSGDANPDACYENYTMGIRYWQRRAPEVGKYVEEIKFYLATEKEPYGRPHSAFTGLVVLDNTSIDSTTDLGQLKKILSAWQQCNAYSEHTFEFMTSTNFIFVEYDESDRTLEWISIGKRTSIISGCD